VTLPKDREARGEFPMATGLIAYFPDALAWVAKCSLAGNKQHSPGQPLKWRRDVSADHPNKIMRHLSDHLTSDPVDDDGIPHCVKVAWRALAEAQLFLEAQQAKAEKRESAQEVVNRINEMAGTGICTAKDLAEAFSIAIVEPNG
jgi:hypothetical protein